MGKEDEDLEKKIKKDKKLKVNRCTKKKKIQGSKTLIHPLSYMSNIIIIFHINGASLALCPELAIYLFPLINLRK